jgi:hypothetical protein
VSASGQNMGAIVRAKAQHNASCAFPPHTVRLHPFEIERMGWEEGDTIAGLTVEADSSLGTGTLRLICDRVEPPELEVTEAIGSEVHA